MNKRKNSAKQPRVTKIGFIVEDDSDYQSLLTLSKRLTGAPGLQSDYCKGKGCGPIMRKCKKWVEILHKKGCNILILSHDLDRNDKTQLSQRLSTLLTDSPIQLRIVLIPTEELEAWILSDMKNIHSFYSLKKMPKEINHPESIQDPKGQIGRIVRAQTKSKEYSNREHNPQLCATIDMHSMEKCPEFRRFRDFILASAV